jgi:hypothetical protein
MAQVQITISSIVTHDTDSLERIVTNFAIESAPLIADLFVRIKKEQMAKLNNSMTER